jgi:hypothetical protein
MFCACKAMLPDSHLIFFLMVEVGFAYKVSALLLEPPVHFALVILEMGSRELFAQAALKQ